MKKKTNLTDLGSHLKKNLASGSLQFLGFTGDPSDPLARAIIPLPGFCGDLVTHCDNDTSVFYIHFNKSMASVSAVCLLSTEVDSDNHILANFVIDGANTTYGSMVLENELFKISQEGGSSGAVGVVETLEGKMVALLDPPKATLWTVVKKPVPYSPNWDSQASRFSSPFADSGCVANLQPSNSSQGTNSPQVQVDKLYQLQLKPYGLTQFTGKSQNNITESHVRGAIGKFPLRLFSVSPRSLGRYLSQDNKSGYAEVRNCEVRGGTTQCLGAGLFRLDAVSQMYIDLQFSLALKNTANPSLGASPPNWYQVALDKDKISKSCQLNDCAFLKVTDSKKIPYRLTLSTSPQVTYEDFTSLSDEGYSLIKNHSISQIRFRFLGESSEDYFDVTF